MPFSSSTAGALVLEAYGAEANAQSTLQSWSMAKSMLHALVGMLVLDGRIDPDARCPRRNGRQRATRAPRSPGATRCA